MWYSEGIEKSRIDGTALFIHSVTRFSRWEFGGAPRLIGCYWGSTAHDSPSPAILTHQWSQQCHFWCLLRQDEVNSQTEEPPGHQPVMPVSAPECCICKDHEPNTALIPCGHKDFCYDCAVFIVHNENPDRPPPLSAHCATKWWLMFWDCTDWKMYPDDLRFWQYPD